MNMGKCWFCKFDSSQVLCLSDEEKNGKPVCDKCIEKMKYFIRIGCSTYENGVLTQPKIYTFEIYHSGSDGINSYSDSIRIEIESGDPGGEKNEFSKFISEVLSEWYDGAEVYEYIGVKCDCGNRNTVLINQKEIYCRNCCKSWRR